MPEYAPAQHAPELALGLDLAHLLVEILLSRTEALHRTAGGRLRSRASPSLDRGAPVGLSGLALSQLVGLVALDRGHFVTIENFDLGHGLDDFETVVGFLGKGVAEQIELLQESEAREELEEDVKVAQLVITDQKHLQEFESLYAFDISKLIVLAIKLFDSEIARNIIQVP
eukprot:CAMPEP_0185611964 /NCGR_PEP_ID=MMETSP0436-20130131/18688_1 /TAXON_ID=626734 ORGANISM="Favella taraikaensis, Strain Fe Narragansett Bay" /NCGR_SAMPLE_ID=MMETSP0436 /ASSEMBLY_ACC=CAM_ASM_000390 /LENGTH=170 /DNA_ID=CAMNT_0028245053 /DNA_START=629 /DNA_END=1142 /DNA_ORIENTATION=-